MAHKKLPTTAKRKGAHVNFNPEKYKIKTESADLVPVYIPELKMTVMAKPGANVQELRDKYINKTQRLNKGGVHEKKGFIKF